ncbi:MAG: Holliday junction branch migration protein RuvA [Coriobacteriales bacterium]|nr:Holliday junction branch migration protein RuvA [Coriobacteriales bacterium]
MIAQLTGTIIATNESSAILDVGGVGFLVHLPATVLAKLDVEKSATVHTEMIVRDDSISLYGFDSILQHELFCDLISVSGVGPKVALGLLSAFDVTQLMLIIAQEDITQLSSVSGVGKKTAQRIALELRARYEQAATAIKISSNENDVGNNTIDDKTTLEAKRIAEAKEALLTMGFSSAEISVALQGYDNDKELSISASTGTEALLRYALQRLGSKL